MLGNPRFICCFVAIASACCQMQHTDQDRKLVETTTRVFAAVDDLMHQVQVSRKAKRFDDAERQCLAAIQLLNEIGWKGRGETAILGMIYYERGDKRLGFVTLRDSYEGSHGGAEAEIYLGRMAIELREYRTAFEVVQRCRQRDVPGGPLPYGTEKYWPDGKDPQSLQATTEFLEGNRQCQTRETKTQGIKLLLHANQLVPANVAINFVLGQACQSSETPLAAAPYYRLVSEKAKGRLKVAADIWLDRNKDKLKAAENRAR